MKRWSAYLVTVSLGLLALVYLMARWNFPTNIAEIWSGDNHPKDTQSDVGTTLNEQTVLDDVLEGLRQKHHLRPLTELEEGTKPQDLPNGIYGFSRCDVPTLSAKRDNTFSLEIHKKRDGIVYYVGYASDEDIAKYLTLQTRFHIRMYSRAYETTTSLLEIPIAFVSKCESHPFRDGYLFDLFVKEIPQVLD